MPEHDFGGVYAAPFLLTSLPGVVYALYYLCNANGCLHLQPFSIPPLGFDEPLFSWTATFVVLAWFLWLAVLYYIVPCQVVRGVKQPNGVALEYRINGFSSFVISLIALLMGWSAGVVSPAFVYDNFLQVQSAAIAFSFVLSIYVYRKSFEHNPDKVLVDGGNTGSMLYDLFKGRELNPRDFGFDWKFFCELRPGLFGWVVINLSMMAAQYEKHGSVTASMLLVNLFQFIYVMDSVVVESAILTTMDIVSDGFGFMLAFGDLGWVPFVYTLQARYLVDHPTALSTPMILGIVSLKILGYYMFRASNLEKNTFRNNPTDPSVSHLKSIPTERGTRLLISGWWGMSRHINYFGDWLMSLAWCLTTGFDSPLPYFYCVYFAILLVHRQMRDDDHCHHKYGKDWDKYCSIVKYRIIPYVY
jgi:Delta14-sterol reductase